jgi:hypothetical protein
VELEVDGGCRLARRWHDGGTSSPQWGSLADRARQLSRRLAVWARVHDVRRGRGRHDTTSTVFKVGKTLHGNAAMEGTWL